MARTLPQEDARRKRARRRRSRGNWRSLSRTRKRRKTATSRLLASANVFPDHQYHGPKTPQ